MSCSTMLASVNDGVVRMSAVSFGPHCLLPPPTMTIRMPAPQLAGWHGPGNLTRVSRLSQIDSSSLPVEPAEQHGDRTRIVAELVARTGDDPHLGRSVGVGDHSSVKVGDGVVIGAVHHQQGPGTVLR